MDFNAKFGIKFISLVYIITWFGLYKWRSDKYNVSGTTGFISIVTSILYIGFTIMVWFQEKYPIILIITAAHIIVSLIIIFCTKKKESI
jgi:hypothetical protein